MKSNNINIRHVIWILVIATILICLLPLLLTRFSVVDFTNTGQIGDTIGGIMGPFVAIVASFLTFLAFLMQYQANEIQKKELKRQSMVHDKEQFEAKIYQMLDVYNKNVSRLRAGDLEGKRAIPELLSELHFIYRCVRYAYIDIKASGITLLMVDKEQREEMELYMKEVLKDAGAENLELMKFAYTLFFYGFPRVNPYEKYNDIFEETDPSLGSGEIRQEKRCVNAMEIALDEIDEYEPELFFRIERRLAPIIFNKE